MTVATAGEKSAVVSWQELPGDLASADELGPWLA